MTTFNPDPFSREGTMHVAGAKVTEVELNVIEAELNDPTKKMDKMSVIISVLTAGTTITNILNTAEWFKLPAQFVIFCIAIGLVSIQLYRFCTSFKKVSKHENNVRDIMRLLREGMKK